jgi:hypothetical protein
MSIKGREEWSESLTEEKGEPGVSYLLYSVRIVDADMSVRKVNFQYGVCCKLNCSYVRTDPA